MRACWASRLRLVDLSAISIFSVCILYIRAPVPQAILVSVSLPIRLSLGPQPRLQLHIPQNSRSASPHRTCIRCPATHVISPRSLGRTTTMMRTRRSSKRRWPFQPQPQPAGAHNPAGTTVSFTFIHSCELVGRGMKARSVAVLGVGDGDSVCPRSPGEGCL